MGQKIQPKRQWAGSSLLSCNQVPGDILLQGILAARTGCAGKGSSRAWGKLQMFQHLEDQRGKKKGRCNSGEKWRLNSCQTSCPPHVVLCPLPCCWRQEWQPTLSWTLRLCKEPGPRRSWDTRHGQTMKATTRFCAHTQIWYNSVSRMIVCKTALFNPKLRVLWKLHFPSCIVACTTQSMKYKTIYFKL